MSLSAGCFGLQSVEPPQRKVPSRLVFEIAGERERERESVCVTGDKGSIDTCYAMVLQAPVPGGAQ